jgi:hypothetical protein
MQIQVVQPAIKDNFNRFIIPIRQNENYEETPFFIVTRRLSYFM